MRPTEEEYERLQLAMETLDPEKMSDVEQALALHMSVVVAHQVNVYRLVTHALRLSALNFGLVAALYWIVWNG